MLTDQHMDFSVGVKLSSSGGDPRTLRTNPEECYDVYFTSGHPRVPLVTV